MNTELLNISKVHDTGVDFELFYELNKTLSFFFLNKNTSKYFKTWLLNNTVKEDKQSNYGYNKLLLDIYYFLLELLVNYKGSKKITSRLTLYNIVYNYDSIYEYIDPINEDIEDDKFSEHERYYALKFIELLKRDNLNDYFKIF